MTDGTATQTRTFPLHSVLAIITLKSLSDRSTDDRTEILDYMKGEPVGSLFIIGTMELCRQELIAQHPRLGDIDPATLAPENWKEWLARHIQTFGETLPVRQIDMTEEKAIAIGTRARAQVWSETRRSPPPQRDRWGNYLG